MSVNITRERILKQTYILLLKRGFDGVSISDIQKANGIARGLLYHYFGNKDQLFIEATTHYFSSLFFIDLDEIKGLDMPQMIDYMVNRYEELLMADEEVRSAGITIGDYDFLFYRVIKENEAFASKYTEYRLREHHAWKLVLHNECTQGRLRADIDVERTATYFVLLMDGLWMDAVNKNSADSMINNLYSVLHDYYRLLVI